MKGLKKTYANVKDKLDYENKFISAKIILKAIKKSKYL